MSAPLTNCAVTDCVTASAKKKKQSMVMLVKEYENGNFDIKGSLILSKGNMNCDEIFSKNFIPGTRIMYHN
jgi:hypothetical protein